MSFVTGITLQFSCGEENEPEIIATINSLLLSSQRYKDPNIYALEDMSDQTNGDKHPQYVLLAGGFNYLNLVEFSQLVGSLAWEYPEQVLLTACLESNRIRIFRFDPSTEVWGEI